MRTVGKLAGLCLAVAFMMGMVLVESASAETVEPGWLLCLEGSNSENTKYEDNSCTKANSTGKWESIGLGSKSDTVKLQTYTVVFKDTKATGGSAEVRCGKPTAGWGLISETALLLIKEYKVASPKTECERVEGGCKAGEVEKVEAIHLPWKTEPFETEGKLLSKVEADGNGEPGWEIECNTLLGKVKDTCESEAGKPEEVEAKNEVVGGVLLVTGSFKHSIKDKCSQGGAGSGESGGQVAISKATGLSLAPRPEFTVHGPMKANVGEQATFTIENITKKEKIKLLRIVPTLVGGFMLVNGAERTACLAQEYTRAGANSKCTFKVFYKEKLGGDFASASVRGQSKVWTAWFIDG